MPAQEPVASSISRSNSVRCSSRCASSRRPCAVELVEARLQLLLDRLDRLQQRRARRHIMRIGVDLDEFEVLRLLAGQRIEFGDRLDLVAEEADAPGAVLVMGGKDVDRVAAHAEDAAREIAERALVLQRDEVGDELALVDLLAELQREGHRRIGLDRADAVDAGDRGDDDDVVALEQRARRRMAHAVDLLVDRRIPSRYRCRCAAHRLRAGNSRNRRRNIRPRCRERSS